MVDDKPARLTKKQILKRIVLILSPFAIIYWRIVLGWCILLLMGSYVLLGQINFLPLGGLWSQVTNLSTEWAPNYSIIKFYSVDIGDTKQEVLKKIGPPLIKRPRYWSYTTAAEDYTFHARAIEFDNHGRVIAKCSKVWDEDASSFARF